MAYWAGQRRVAPKHVMFPDMKSEAVLLNLQSEAYFDLDAEALLGQSPDHGLLEPNNG